MFKGKKGHKKSKKKVQAESRSVRRAPVACRTAQVPAHSSFVHNFTELLAALEAQYAQITLAADVIVQENILINHDVAINFNGFSIISPESRANARVLDVRRGDVVLTGKGKIFAMGKQSIAIRVFGSISNNAQNYTTLNVDEGISLFAPDSYGIIISPNLGVAYGVTITLSGQIFSHDGIGINGAIRTQGRNFPLIRIKTGASITADETNGVAIEAAGSGRWEISSANLSGAAGVNLAAGELNFRHSEVIGRDITFNFCPVEAQPVTLTIDGGTYIAERGANLAGVGNSNVKIFLLDGEFYASGPNVAQSLELLVDTEKKVYFNENVTEMLQGILPSETSTPLVIEPTLPPEPLPQNAEGVKIPHSPRPASEPESINAFISHPAEDIEPASKSDDLNIFNHAEGTPAEITQIINHENITPVKAPQALNPENTAPAENLPTPQSLPTIAPLTTIQPETSNADQPIIPPAPAPDPAEVAARLALADAIKDVRKLNADDYNIGFNDLEEAIQNADRLLQNPQSRISDICSAASRLLRAFDGLHENDDLSLSDAELDELFYHGAVLEEMVSDSSAESDAENFEELNILIDGKEIPKAPSLSLLSATKPSPKKAISPANIATQLSLQAQSYDATKPLATDFAKMVELLNRIASLDLNHYLAASQVTLLDSLAEAEEALNDPTCSQEDVDEITERLTDGLRQLEPIRSAHLAYPNKANIPAPAVHEPIAITLIDEMSPAANWSLGVTMIDELTPFATDSDTLEKMIRATKPVLAATIETALSPLRKLSRSLAAGARAGMAAYRETLHSFRN